MSTQTALAEAGLRSNPPPAARIDGAPRKTDNYQKPVLIRNKETGEEVQLSIANARDLVQNVGGWEYVKVVSKHDGPPKEAAAVAVDQSGDEGDEGDEGAGDDNTGPTVSPEVAELNALRDKAAALGVEVDQRWGKRRLSEEIAKKSPSA